MRQKEKLGPCDALQIPEVKTVGDEAGNVVPHPPEWTTKHYLRMPTVGLAHSKLIVLNSKQIVVDISNCLFGYYYIYWRTK